jgi:hypothetical protein
MTLAKNGSAERSRDEGGESLAGIRRRHLDGDRRAVGRRGGAEVASFLEVTLTVP